jgi:hypothetical protein
MIEGIAQSPRPAEPKGPAPFRSSPAEGAPESPFSRVLAGLGKEIDHGETLVQRAVSGASHGKDLGGLELLALQSSVYRYSEAVDLTAKVIDRACSGLKTVIQGQ